MKHTQGTWKFTSDRTALLSLNERNEHRKIMDTSVLWPSKADARLIEASPDMLKALESVAYILDQEIETAENSGLGDCKYLRIEVGQIRALIARIEGGGK